MASIGSIINRFSSANRFKISFFHRKVNDKSEKIDVFVKGVEIPAKEKKTVDFVYNGVKYPLAREHAFKNETEITFYSGENDYRDLFIDWMDTITDGSKKAQNINDSDKIYSEILIEHYSSIGNIDNAEMSNSYKMLNAFPREVSGISLSSDSNEIMEFMVTFAYSEWLSI